MAAAVVAAVAVTVSTFGAGTVAGVAVITSALSIAAKATEVAVLQTKKSTRRRNSTGENSSGSNSKTSGEKSGAGEVATDVIDAVFDNGLKFITPSVTKILTTSAAFAKHDLFNNPVLNSDFRGFVAGPASKLGIATAYGFAAYSWIQTTISIFSDNPEQRAEKRGYRLR